MPDFHDASLAFLQTELKAGCTFAEMARDAQGDPDKRLRNKKNAEVALEALQRFLPHAVGLRPEERQTLIEGIQKLEAAIASIRD